MTVTLIGSVVIARSAPDPDRTGIFIAGIDFSPSRNGSSTNVCSVMRRPAAAGCSIARIATAAMVKSPSLAGAVSPSGIVGGSHVTVACSEASIVSTSVRRSATVMLERSAVSVTVTSG